MKRILVLLSLVTVLFTANVNAKGHPKATKTHTTKTESTRVSTARPKTEHVSGYTRKNGTHVKAYNRRPRK